MPEFRALPLWTDAYLADTDHLSDAEHGRYLMLLIQLWRAPGQRLPNDDEWLARKFRRPVERVRSELRPLIGEFCRIDGNWILQKRLTREAEHLKKQSRNQSVRAKSRWGNKKDACPEDAARHASGNASVPYRKEDTPNPAVGGELNNSKIEGGEDIQPPVHPAPGSRAEGMNPRALGTDLRSNGTNPRALGTNPRAVAEAAETEAARDRHASTIAKWQTRLKTFAATGEWDRRRWGEPPDPSPTVKLDGVWLPRELHQEFRQIHAATAERRQNSAAKSEKTA